MSRPRPLHSRFAWLRAWWTCALAVALALMGAAQLGAATASISSVAIVSPLTDYAPNQSLLIDVTFSEAVTVTGTPSFNINTGGTATYLAGSGPRCSPSSTASEPRTTPAGRRWASRTRLKIATANVACVLGADTPPGASWAWPGSGLTPPAFIAPVMTAASFGIGPYTDLTSLTCTFTCSEALTAFASGDLVLGGTASATVGAITRSGTTVTVPLTVTSIGTLTVGVALSSAAADSDGNTIDASHSAVAAITVGPVPAPTAILALTASPTASATESWTVTFNTPVQGVNAANFQRAAGTGLSVGFLTAATNPPGVPSAAWTVTANSVAGSGTLALAVANMSGVSDAAGDPASTGSPNPVQSITVDQTLPTITSFVQTDLVTTDAAVRHYTVNFSTSVEGVSAANFTVVAAGGAAGSIGAVTEVSAAAWQVTLIGVSVASGSGTVSLNVAPGGITDALGNALGAVAACPAYTVGAGPAAHRHHHRGAVADQRHQRDLHRHLQCRGDGRHHRRLRRHRGRGDGLRGEPHERTRHQLPGHGLEHQRHRDADALAWQPGGGGRRQQRGRSRRRLPARARAWPSTRPIRW